MMRVGFAGIAGVLACVLMTCACSAGPDSPDSGPAVDIGKLDVGNLPTTPHRYAKAKSLDQARGVEAERLANVIPLPQEIDKTFDRPAAVVPGAVRVFIDFGSLAMTSRTTAKPAVLNNAAKGFTAAFVSTGQNRRIGTLGSSLDNTVMLFSDDKSASAAAQALGQADLSSNPANHKISLAEHPDAVAYTTDGQPGAIHSWYATGQYVIFTYVWDDLMSELKSQDLPLLIGHVEQSIDVIAPRIREFHVTPPDKMMDLDVDMDGVLGRTLHTAIVDSGEAGIPGVYDGHGGLHIAPDPQDDPQLFRDTGVDRVAWSGGFVYRARDHRAAEQIVEKHSEFGRYLHSADPPRGLPDARCLQYIGPQEVAVRFYCHVSRGRYAADISAEQLSDAHQRISAQYALLTDGN